MLNDLLHKLQNAHPVVVWASIFITLIILHFVINGIGKLIWELFS